MVRRGGRHDYHAGTSGGTEGSDTFHEIATLWKTRWRRWRSSTNLFYQPRQFQFGARMTF
jgi:hypothetical protein